MYQPGNPPQLPQDEDDKEQGKIYRRTLSRWAWDFSRWVYALIIPIANYAPRVSTLNGATGSFTLDVTNTDVWIVNAVGNCTVDFTGGVEGKIYRVRFVQDATGSRTWTSGTSVRYGTDITSAAMVATTTASKTDYFAVSYNAIAAKYDFVSYVRGF